MDRRLALITVIALLISSLLTACSQSVDAEAAHVFDDIPDDSPWGHAVQEIGSDGYMCGKSKGKFDPQATLSRAEVAVLLVKAMHGPDYSPDAMSGAWWECWIECAVKDGLMEPVSDPQSPATRADVATLMWLMSQ